jgi:hypothetical protein
VKLSGCGVLVQGLGFLVLGLGPKGSGLGDRHSVTGVQRPRSKVHLVTRGATGRTGGGEARGIREPVEEAEDVRQHVGAQVGERRIRRGRSRGMRKRLLFPHHPVRCKDVGVLLCFGYCTRLVYE